MPRSRPAFRAIFILDGSDSEFRNSLMAEAVDPHESASRCFSCSTGLAAQGGSVRCRRKLPQRDYSESSLVESVVFSVDITVSFVESVVESVVDASVSVADPVTASVVLDPVESSLF